MTRRRSPIDHAADRRWDEAQLLAFQLWDDGFSWADIAAVPDVSQLAGKPITRNCVGGWVHRLYRDCPDALVRKPERREA